MPLPGEDHLQQAADFSCSCEYPLRISFPLSLLHCSFSFVPATSTPPLVTNLSFRGQHSVPVQLPGPRSQGSLHPRCPSAGKRIAKCLRGIAAQKPIPTWLTRSLPGHRDEAAAPCRRLGGRLVGWLCWAVRRPERGTALHPTAAFHQAFAANGALCYIL